MRVNVLIPLALLFTLQRVAGSPRTVVIDDDSDEAMFAWETNQQYASESPWPSMEVSSYFSMAPSMNYPVGMADKETSMPGSSDSEPTGLFEMPDDASSAVVESVVDGPNRLVETETVFITVSGAVNEMVESAVPEAEGSAGSDVNNQNVAVNPNVEVNLSIINGQIEAVTNTVGPSVVTVTAGAESPSPSVVTVTAGAETSSPSVVTVTAGAETSSPSVVTVTAGAESPSPSAAQATSTVVETISSTNIESVTQTAFETIGFGNAADAAGNAMATQGAQSNGSFAAGGGGSWSANSGGSVGGKEGQQDIGAAQQVGHSTYVQTVMTASMDIVRVIGPSYTSTISMHMQPFDNGVPAGNGYDMISPAAQATPVSSAVMPMAMPTYIYNAAAQGQGSNNGGSQVVGSSGSSQYSYYGGSQGSSNGGSQGSANGGSQGSANGGSQNPLGPGPQVIA
ncbi:hypothetical protein IWW50_000125 [Coemansia erecta]|nr:hypothetical protein IWW50_000125 [Coemansia erecta]